MPALKPITEKIIDGPDYDPYFRTVREGQVRFICASCGNSSIGDVQETFDKYRLRRFPSGGYGRGSTFGYLIAVSVCLVFPPRLYPDIIVRCTNCGKCFRSLLRIDRMVRLSPEELAPYIRLGSTSIERLIVILGLLIFFVPLLGFVLSILGLYLCRGTRDWARNVGLTGFVLGGGVTAVVGMIMLFEFLRIK
jgi:hypothetical protein